jgi:hypothetical protein
MSTAYFRTFKVLR